MPTQPKPSAKPPLDPDMRRVTLSLPKALIAEVNALAKETGISRATLINKILLECTSQYSTAHKPPLPCPRGHIRPCERKTADMARLVD